MSKLFVSILVSLLFVSCALDDGGGGAIGISELPETPVEDEQEVGEEEVKLTDEELLDLTQKETFKYFWDFAQTESGAARERYHPQEPSNDVNTVTVGGTGFGLMGILVAMERGFVSRSEGVERLSKVISFLENADRFHGAWPHWLDGRNGKTLPFSEKDNGADLVETSFLAQGLICVKEYLKEGSSKEKEVAEKADALWKGVEWDWFTQNKNTLYWHWSPDFGFDINLELKGYNEVLITYVMASASPDFSITKETYENGWASNGAIANGTSAYDIPLTVNHAGSSQKGGPLFWAHYSYMGLDPSNLADAFVNYGDATVNHAKINYAYCVDNPKSYKDYGEDCWGLTASYSRNADGSLGYNAHSPSNDTGIISPTAALSSMPYTPEESMKALRYFYSKKDQLLGPAGFYDAFSPQNDFWIADAYLAIDQGPILIMIENHRSGLLWQLFMQNEDVQRGLNNLGFTY